MTLLHDSACIIPVRGGSKGLARKNLADFGGMPLLAWTIRQAREVYAQKSIFVTSDDAEMLQLALDCGVQAIRRPDALASDTSTSASAVAHALEQIDPERHLFPRFCLLQVTSPLRRAEDIREAEAKMQSSSDYDSVVSVYEDAEAQPGKLYRMLGEKAEVIAPDLAFLRRQDQPAIYRRNGALYACKRSLFERTGQVWGGHVGLVIMPKACSIDIDTQANLDEARRLLALQVR